MRPVLAVLLFVLNAGCATGATRSTASSQIDFSQRFLSTWLVTRDLKAASSFMHAQFYSSLEGHTGVRDVAGGAAPDPIGHALSFPFGCRGFPAECGGLQDCIRAVADSGPQPFELAELRVTEEMTRETPALRPFLGKRLSNIVFVLEDCNIGASVLIVPDEPSDRRVLSIFFAAK